MLRGYSAPLLADSCSWFRASLQFLVSFFVLSADATCSLAEWLPFAMTFDITDEEAIQFWHAVCTWAPPSDVHNIDDDLAALYSCIRKYASATLM